MSYKKFVKNIGIISFTTLVSTLGGIILLPIITKLLGAQEYGIWVVIITIISLAPLLLTLGLPLAIGRFLPGEKNKKEIQDGIYSALSVTFVVCSVFSFFVIIFANHISKFLNIGESTLIVLLGPIFILECLNLIFFATIRAFQKIKAYSFFIIFAGSGQPILAIILILLGYGILGAVVALLLMRIILFLMMFIFTIKLVGLKIPNFAKTKDYLFLGLPSLGSYTSSWIIKSSDRYLINFFLGIVFVGYYAPGCALGNILILFLGPLSFILPVVLAEHFDSNKIDEVKTYLKYSLKYFLLFAIPGAFGLSVLSKQILTIFSTPEIASNGYIVTSFLAFAVLFYGICDIFEQILLLFKKTKISSAIWITVALLNIALNLILIPIFGIIGAGIASLTTMVSAASITYLYSAKYLKFKFEIDRLFIFKIISASVLMSLFILWLKPLGFYKTVTAVILSVLFYSALIFLLKCFDRKELDFLKGLVRKT